MLAAARIHSPFCASVSVCRLNEENVVKPPSRPSITNWRAVVPTSSRPSGPDRVANRPISREPTTFTATVPQGNVSPTQRATRPEHQ
jgi:hypothetical protein